ncbi:MULTISPECIES: IS3 family transposase [unclassified Cryobacterium]|uniref:IS3 family transposase n=1 Tax=unclassified Cryobacterium TaxID=2649013 RepID=UPI00343A882C
MSRGLRRVQRGHGQHLPGSGQTQNDIVRYIDGFYNSRRRQSSIGQVSPVDFEMQYSSQLAEVRIAA